MDSSGSTDIRIVDAEKNIIIMKDRIGSSIQFPNAGKASLKQDTHNFGNLNPFTLNTAFQYI